MPDAQTHDEPYELVVDQRDREAVEDVLRKIDVPWTLRKEHKRLRLAVLARPTGDAAAPYSMDMLLGQLRQWFVDHYHGWTPTVDKNHSLDWVQGAPVKKGAARPPKRLDATDPIPQFAAGPPVDRAVRVGVLDTGLYRHPALEGHYEAAPGTVFSSTDGLFGTAGHATFIAGVILQRAPGARLDVRAVLSNDNATASSWDVATKMAEFVDTEGDPRDDIDILNMSFGCATHDGKPPLALARAVDLLTPKVLLVAAAGNYGEFTDDDAASGYTGPTATTPQWPAAFADVVAVGAHGPEADFSPAVPWIDLSAPGVDVTSTFLPGEVKIRTPDGPVLEDDFGVGYAKWSGTSFASANAAGEIAARMAAGNLSADHALDALLSVTGGTENDIFHHEPSIAADDR